MSMSEIYALSVVAELGFMKGCAFFKESTADSLGVPDKCRDAIRIVGSCSRLIVELWYTPDSEQPYPQSTSTFNFRPGP